MLIEHELGRISMTTERPPGADWRDTAFRVTVRLALPVLLPLEDGPYVVAVPSGITARVFLTAVQRALDEPPTDAIAPAHEFPAGRVQGAEGLQIPGRLLRFTAVAIDFGLHQDRDVSDEDLTVMEEAAYQALRLFLEAYRDRSVDPSIRPLTRSEFFEVRAQQPLVVSVQATVAGLELRDIHMPRYATHAARDPRPLLDTAFHEGLRKALETGQTPPLGSMLLLDGRAALDRGDTRRAVMNIHAALDVVIEHKALLALSVAGVAAGDARSRVGALSSRRIVQQILHQRLTIDVIETQEWKEWDGEFRHLRNQVVHEDVLPDVHSTRRYLNAGTGLLNVIILAPVRQEHAGEHDV